MTKVLYVWKGKYPWDIRAEKICNSLYQHGWDVYLLARWTTGQAERENYNGINIIRAGYNKNYKFTQPVSLNPIWKKAIKQAVDDIKPDIIIPRDIMLAEACGKIGRSKNIPVLMDMAENYPAAMKGWKKYSKSFFSRLIVHKLDIPELVEKRAVKLMDGIFTVCDEQNQRIDKVYGFDFNKICVAHNTPAKEFFLAESRQQTTERNKLPITNYELRLDDGDSKPRIIFGHHGFTSDEKSLEKFLFGFGQAAIENNNIEFHIAGHGESIEHLKEISSKFSAKDRIIFSGEYNYNELPSIISRWDIGVIPYQLNDFNNYTIHNKIFDFFAMGKPVFCSETLPYKRIISETKAGITVNCEKEFEIRDSILKMVGSDLTEMSKNGRKAFEEKYNWDVDFANLLGFIKGFI